MAPEQARGNPKEMDERSDVFGIGAILYELVSGKVPYGRLRGAEAVLKQARANAVVDIEQAAAGIGVSRTLRNIIARATSPKPADRYQSVLDLQRDITSFLRGGLYLPRKAFGPGEIIIREGDVGDAAYMIVSGSLPRLSHRRRRGRDPRRHGGAETYSARWRSCSTVRAPRPSWPSSRSTVLVLGKATMTEGLGTDGWTGALVRALAKRFRDLEQQVRNSGMRRG